MQLNAGPAKADQERPNEPHVTAGKPYGRCYVRSLPSDNYLQQGITQVYQVADGPEDQLLFEFDWYSRNIHLYCSQFTDMHSSLSLVRLGKWPRYSEANADELAIEFYYGGKQVGKFSTLDIAGSPSNVQASASHYRVIEKIVGYGYSGQFTIITVDGRKLGFDTQTGQLKN